MTEGERDRQTDKDDWGSKWCARIKRSDVAKNLLKRLLLKSMDFDVKTIAHMDLYYLYVVTIGPKIHNIWMSIAIQVVLSPGSIAVSQGIQLQRRTVASLASERKGLR